MVSGPIRFKVLVVDDDPDVISVTKLALREMDGMGLPLEIQTAASKAEAIELYEQQATWMADVAVALIDVVMESDEAGLELCHHIREVAQDRNVQIFIRTGQPGVAPERKVIDQYDISGYFTKAEATEDKLYSMVKTGIRQYETTRNLAGALAMLEGIVSVSHSRAAMKEVFVQMLSGFLPAEQPGNGLLFTVEDEPILGPFGWDETTARAVMAELMDLPGRQIRPEGDKIVSANDGDRLIVLPADGNRPRSAALLRVPGFEPPDRVIVAIHGFMRNFASLWARAE